MRIPISLTILCLLLVPICASAELTTEMEIGARGGLDDRNGGTRENYAAAEVYFLKQLPWDTTLGEQTTLTSRFDLGAIYLEAVDDESGMLAAGADLVLGFWDNYMEVEIGFRPAWMFDHKYGVDDFGGGLQFISHAGIAINWQPMTFSYRFQHISNAGIYDENPGINLHMFGLGYRF